MEWFHRAQPTGGGRQLGLSHPVRTETVNTAMASALLSGTNRGRGGGERTHLSLPSSFPHRAKKLSLVSCSGVMYVRISGIQLPFPFSWACNLPHSSHMLWVPASITHSSRDDLIYDQPVRTQTVYSYTTDLDPFSPPFCLNLITLHLRKCHYQLQRFNSALSNEHSIKWRAPTRQTGSNKPN